MKMMRIKEVGDLLELYRILVTQIDWGANLCPGYNGEEKISRPNTLA